MGKGTHYVGLLLVSKSDVNPYWRPPGGGGEPVLIYLSTAHPISLAYEISFYNTLGPYS